MSDFENLGELRLRYSPRKLFRRWLRAYLILGVGGVAISLRANPPDYGFKVLVGLFVVGTILLLWKVFSRHPQLTINSDGICDQRLGIGTLPWSAIKSTKLFQQYGASLILLSLQDTEKHLPKLSLYRRLLTKWYSLDTPCDIWFDLSDLEGNASTVIRIIDQNRIPAQ